MIKWGISVALFFLSLPAFGVECSLSGKVVSITDGDTIKILTSDKQQYKIRLAGIDAPEKGQPYSKAAKKQLSKWIAKKNVCIQSDKKDRYGRVVGKVLLGEADVNYSMVAAGYAWHYKKYAREQHPLDSQAYAQAEIEARSDVIGLWQEPDPIAPWEWRKGNRQAPKRKPKLPKNQQPFVNETDFSCGTKRFCRHMDSCAEACFYLNECGLGRLDRDKDGIPCESFCGGCR